MHLEAGFVTILMMIHVVQSIEYLVAIPHKAFESPTSVYATADETGGTLHCKRPNQGWHRYVDMQQWGNVFIYFQSNVGVISEIEYKAILITCSNRAAYVRVFNGYMAFAPLPTTALGTSYILSSCYQSGYYYLLVIAAYNLTTTVSIKATSPIFGPIFNRQNTRIYELKPFQTITFEHHSYLTGTIVNSTQPVAVFSGMTNSKELVAYEQLLPVRLYDKEYVVAVDDNPAMYQLQILSEHNDTVITFNNGSSINVNSTLYQTQLTSSERFYFQSSNPVMTTICRRDGTGSGFIVVPPISLYSIKVAWFVGKTNFFITRQETFINSSYIRWTHMSDSGYKIGVSARRSINIRVLGCNLLFYTSYMWTNGIADGQSTQTELRKSYIVASPNSNSNHVRLLLSSSQAASYQVVFPHQNQTYTREMLVSSSDNFYIEEDMKVQGGVENKAVRVDVDSEDNTLCIGTSYLSSVSAIFPTSLLGREYIVQACYGKITEFQLILVSSSMNTDINVLLSKGITYDGVEYKHGDTIRVRLQPYQTLTINSSVALCGTSVSASHNVAVFTLYGFENTISYIQLLPVEGFGKEYIVFASDQTFMILTSANDDTQVKFTDDLQVTVGEGTSYRKDLGTNESIHFTSTKPVMTSLCLRNSNQCTIVVPTHLYTTESKFKVIGTTGLNILTQEKNAHFNLTWSSHDGTYQDVSIEIAWEIHSDYRIGIARVDEGQISISSTHRFTTLAFSGGGLWNPFGWNRPTDTYTGAGGDITTNVDVVNTTAVAVGATLSVIILLLLAVIICQQIYMRRTVAKTVEKTDGRTGENETSFSQDQPQNRGVASTVSTAAVYSELHTEPQVPNTYESMNPSLSDNQQVVYETFESCS